MIPGPPGATRLVGTDDLWRIRVGHYRVVYAIAVPAGSCVAALEARANREHQYHVQEPIEHGLLAGGWGGELA
ncbi:MAG: type II toxin-antitoxin system RelE family toxin [Pseudonocardiaceae bacterium]